MLPPAAQPSLENPITKSQGVICQKHNLSQSWFLRQDVSPCFSYTLSCSVLLPPSSEFLSVLGAPQVITQDKREGNFISWLQFLLSLCGVTNNPFQHAAAVHCSLSPLEDCGKLSILCVTRI